MNSKNNDGWISIKDRLPERIGLDDDMTEYVLVCETAPSGNKYVSVCGYEATGWSDWDNFGTINPKNITHWMPLPEPPKEE